MASMQQYPWLPLMRELSAKLTEGETFAPSDQYTRIRCGSFGLYPNYTLLLRLNAWTPNHLSVVHLFLLAPACSVRRRQVREPASLLHNKSLQYNCRSLFAFGNAPDSCARSHTIVFVPKGSYSFAAPLPEGYSLCYSFSFSLPPSRQRRDTSLVRGRFWYRATCWQTEIYSFPFFLLINVYIPQPK